MISVGASATDGGGNPYLSLLHTALRAQGVTIHAADLHPWRLRSAPAKFDVLHIHWPEHIMVGPGEGLAHTTRAMAAAVAFRKGVAMLKARGVRIVWTAHNLRPHDPAAPTLQVSLYRWLAQEADAVIVHTPHAAQLVRSRLGRSTGPMYLARHGNYVGAYGQPTTDRRTLRHQYGFSDSDNVLLAFGQIRGYKRLLELADDFAAHAPTSTRLIIAGVPRDADITSRLMEMASANKHLTVLGQKIPDAEVGQLFSLADLAVFNYAEIFSSGALLLALSLGRAAIVPAQETTDDFVTAPALFTWRQSPFEAVADALKIAADARERAALDAANRHDWADAARVHIAAYEGLPPNLP